MKLKKNSSKLTLNKLTVSNLNILKKNGMKNVEGGTIKVPFIDIPTFNDYSCWWGGGCDSGRCSEVNMSGCAEYPL